MNYVICLEVITLNKPLKSLDHIHADQELKDKTLNHVLNGKKRKSYPSYGKLASAFLILCLCISFPLLYLYHTSSSQRNNRLDKNIEAIVSFDINPSMEFKIDNKFMITSIKSYNQDAKDIVSSLDLKGKRIDDAIDILLQDPTYKTYFENGILEIGIYAKNHQLSTELDTLVQKKLSTKLSSSQYHCSHINEKTHVDAHKSHTSIGKYRVIEEILSYDKTYSLDSLSNKSMKELYEILSLYSPNDVPESCQRSTGKNGHHGKHH